MYVNNVYIWRYRIPDFWFAQMCKDYAKFGEWCHSFQTLRDLVHWIFVNFILFFNYSWFGLSEIHLSSFIYHIVDLKLCYWFLFYNNSSSNIDMIIKAQNNYKSRSCLINMFLWRKHSHRVTTREETASLQEFW